MASITDTSWILIRHAYAFVPKPWVTVLCARDMHAEVIPGVPERRAQFVLDAHTGQGWHREGTGKYLYWSDIPPLGQWCSRDIAPPVGHQCLFWLVHGPNTGINIGRLAPQKGDTTLWQIRPPDELSWKPVISKVIGGWLLLPTDAE